jgi:PAS domain S-box-containing protein
MVPCGCFSCFKGSAPILKGRPMTGVNTSPLSKSDGQLFAEKIHCLYANQKSGYIGTLVNACILAAIQWKQVDHPILYAWVGLVLGITLGRGVLAARFNHREKSLDRSGYWGNLSLAGIFASGTAWGLAGIFLFPRTSDAHQMFTAFTIGGMVAGASAVYSAFRSAFFAFSLPAMLPVIINSMTFQDDIHVGMAVMLTLYWVLMTATMLRNNAVMETSIKLRFENQDLLEFLSLAKERDASINKKLQTEIIERKRVEAELEKHQKQLESEVEKRSRELQDRNQELQFEIHERTRVESELRDSEKRYRLLIENTIVGIIVIRDQKIIFANTFVAMISGYSVEEILGSPFIDFIHPDDRELAVANHMRRLSDECFADSYAIRMLNRKNEVRWVEVSAVCLSYESQPAILVFMRDISQQRKLEAQLFQSEKMASIGQLAAGVAHEINNPVGFVNSNLHTLKGYQEDLQQLIPRYQDVLTEIKGCMSGPARDAILQKIRAIESLEAEADLGFILEDSPQLINESQEGTERIKKIVLDLKNFAHPGEQNRQMIDINKNIESTLNIVWNELKYHAEVIKDFGRIPQIEGYPQQLNQVFMNLLVNAAQALEGKGEIWIQTREKNGKVEVKISDTGCGIPQENLKQIFDPFFTTKPVGKGTGLGLNVSYNIIKKHNGTIDATSKVGEGTAFTIQLPI